ncbi:hypothetical protein BN975_00146 [Mycolicibacterium farcinogenes]|nr:hypothetical protein BN975_00146 [Mycolicibacterium farcinogenes]
MAGARVGEAEDLVADLELRHPGPEFGHHAGEVTALPGGERGREPIVQRAPPDHGLNGG